METIVLTGLQGSGKSSFYKHTFFATHVRISLDLVKTRNREKRLLEVCLETQQRVVIDNTNPTRVDRAKYIGQSRRAGFQVVGYYFSSKVGDCLKRNEGRVVRVPEVGILATAKKLERPTLDEGFDELWYVRLKNNGFVIEEWDSEV